MGERDKVKCWHKNQVRYIAVKRSEIVELCNTHTWEVNLLHQVTNRSLQDPQPIIELRVDTEPTDSLCSFKTDRNLLDWQENYILVGVLVNKVTCLLHFRVSVADALLHARMKITMNK